MVSSTVFVLVFLTFFVAPFFVGGGKLGLVGCVHLKTFDVGTLVVLAEPVFAILGVSFGNSHC